MSIVFSLWIDSTDAQNIPELLRWGQESVEIDGWKRRRKQGTPL
jgi:hypothetical protein